MLESILSGLMAIFSGWTPLYLVIGALLGVVVGVLPALGGGAGLSLLLPFVFGMDPVPAMALMIGMLAASSTGDTVASILLGVPGSASSQATILDGFPLARKGEAARALSAAYFASMLGGLFGAVVLTAVLLAARQVILLFGLPEMLMLVLFGLASVAALSGRSLFKGIAACALGLVLGTVGAAPATGEYRLDFGIYHFGDGINLIAAVLGIFVIPELVDLLRRNGSISDRPLMGSGARQGVLDVIKNKWLVVRTSGIGCLIGALPGVSGSVVDWIAYGHAVRSAKDKSQFGKGDIRGVIAVEGSNNAVLGGALIPTLLFGVPGSGSMALFLSGMVLIGIQPGPAMVQGQLDLTYSIVWSLALANIIGTAVCFALSGWFARLTAIPFAWIAPFLVLVICFAVLQVSRAPLDLAVLSAFGVLGLVLRRFAYSRPAFLIGFVLQDNLEVFLYQAAQVYDLGQFVSRPLVWLIGAAIAFVVLSSILRKDSVDTEQAGEGTFDFPARAKQALVPLGLVVAFGVAIFGVYEFSHLGRLFPLSISIVGVIASLLVLYRTLRGKSVELADQETVVPADQARLLPTSALILAGVAAVGIFGFFIGAALFLCVFLNRVTKVSPVKTLIAAAIGVGAFWFMADLAGLVLPRGLFF